MSRLVEHDVYARDIAEEIKCFQAVSARRRSLHHQLWQCRSCSKRDQNGSRFHVYGVRTRCVQRVHLRPAYSPPAGCIYSVYRPLVYVSVHCYVHNSATLLLPLDRLYSWHCRSEPRDACSLSCSPFDSWHGKWYTVALRRL